MGDPVGLHRLESLEEQHRLQEAVAGRIAVEHRHHVGPRRLADLRRIDMRLVGDLAQDLLAHLARGELDREAIGQRPLHRAVVQDRGMDQPAEKRLGRNGVLRLDPDTVPDRIDRLDLLDNIRHGDLPSELAIT